MEKSKTFKKKTHLHLSILQRRQTQSPHFTPKINGGHWKVCKSCTRATKLAQRPGHSTSEVTEAQYHTEWSLQWSPGQLTLGPSRHSAVTDLTPESHHHEAAACSVWKEKLAWCCSLTYGVQQTTPPICSWERCAFSREDAKCSLCCDAFAWKGDASDTFWQPPVKSFRISHWLDLRE